MPGAIASNLVKWLLGPSMGMLAIFATFGRPRRATIGPYAGSLIYFGALGFGFIAVELALLQNLTLLLGHPIFTLSVLLFTLLAMGGVGSALSLRVPIWLACASVAAIGAVEAIALPKMVPALLWLPLWGRNAISERTASDGQWIASGASVLLGTERHHVGDRISYHRLCRANGGLPGGNADGQRVLCISGFGVEARLSELTKS